MTRKRFKKLLMSAGFSPHDARLCADFVGEGNKMIGELNHERKLNGDEWRGKNNSYEKVYEMTMYLAGKVVETYGELQF